MEAEIAIVDYHFLLKEFEICKKYVDEIVTGADNFTVCFPIFLFAILTSLS